MESKPAKSNSVMIAAGVGILAVLGIGGYLMFGRGSSPSAPATDAPLSSAPADTAAAPTGPTPEEIQAQIQKIVDDKIKSSSAQYEDQLKTLQKQLDDAKKAQEQRAAAASNPAPRPATIPAVPPPSAPATAAAPPPAAAPAESTSRDDAGDRAGGSRGQARAGSGGGTPAAGGRRHRPSRRSGHDGGRSDPAEGRPPREPALPAARPAHEEGGDRHGARAGRRERKAADVQATGSSAGFGMDEAAVEYARSCVFTPATKNGVPVRMWMDIKVAFNLTGS